ncbi:hypothetical protein N8348_03745 [Litorivicinus sp.]|nr:hypothetical protein [Litorivicinus sp.]MDC1240378.1 hypothetical protein [Litorivicinus sp.]MDC1466791.1 hypothetical protein [Litorivicinus sp.]
MVFQRRVKATMAWILCLYCHNLMAAEPYPLIDPPLCFNDRRETVEFITHSASQGEVAAGMANRDSDGRPIIVRMNYDKADPAFQRFVDFHECAHHQVGHVDQPHPPRNSFDHLMNESIADCIAILRIREEANHTYSQVIEELSEAMSLVGFPKISTDSRLSNVQNCYAKEESAAEFVKKMQDQASVRSFSG